MTARSHGRQGEPPPPPEALGVPVADCHTHLDLVLDTVLDTVGGTAEESLALAASVGVDRVMQVGVDVESSRYSAELAGRHPGVLAAVALHPNEAPLLDARGLDEALAVIDELAAQERVRAIGETGLDYYRTEGAEALRRQTESFRRHIDIAKRRDRTLMIHDREAHDAVFRVLREESPPERVVFHCFSGDADMARACAENGWWVSFAGNLTFAKAQSLRDAAAAVPRDRLLVETDAPFLTPTPHRGRPNAPYLVPLTVRAMAAVRDEDVDELCAALSANAEAAFGAWS